MSRIPEGELRPLKRGFAARITIEGRRRKDFILATDDEARALERCRAMADMAARLRRCDHTHIIEPLLGIAAKARAGAPWRAVCASVDAMCAGKTIEIASVQRHVRVQRAAQELGGVDKLLEAAGEAFDLTEPEQP